MGNNILLKAYGKWILAGEYSVLRGGQALVFPLFSHYMELEFFADSSKKKLQYLQDSKGISSIQRSICADSPVKELFNIEFPVKNFQYILKKALSMVFQNQESLFGVLKLRSNICISSGAGSSAVICVLIGRWFQAMGWLKKEELFLFCHALEKQLQAGQSSGLDIAEVLEGRSLLYKNPGQWEYFQIVWKPLIYLSSAGPGDSTGKNIQKVQKLRQERAEEMKAVDSNMEQAVLKAKESLGMPVSGGGACLSEKNRLELLAEAVAVAEKCFFKWGLVGESMLQHIKYLKAQGAIAVKPSGSGDGGCVLSLWRKPPPLSLSGKLISGF